jgi:hypothetical protein
VPGCWRGGGAGIRKGHLDHELESSTSGAGTVGPGLRKRWRLGGWGAGGLGCRPKPGAVRTTGISA